MAGQSELLHDIEDNFATTMQIFSTLEMKLPVICVEQSVHAKFVSSLV
eukprot:CAMPEP_0113681146 /NCGR_PEP_ID=MMETSP0038_2-20120614/11794_1 /TAXON_ID=2898 /ORGANISM="Cryptomonas paramecium" /LENGTH=47 /DNA_ID=CAMNT_0000599769 /DNA_START=32 /DNA_END=171 /DNA_ORIENTATION=+ /assembly_acc=CAM_ASM_000170